MSALEGSNACEVAAIRVAARCVALRTQGVRALVACVTVTVVASTAWASAPLPDGSLFPVPDTLRPAVRFWYDLFTRHTSHHVVIHDRDNLDVVWSVVALPVDDSGELIDTPVAKFTRPLVEDLRVRLKRLSRDPEPQDDEDRVILALVGGDTDRLSGAWQRLRTQRGVADRFREGLERSEKWLGDVQQILSEEGVPAELAMLPFVESMFNPKARSHAGAVGLWQLMPATAVSFGLRVGRGDDERLDVPRATRAAARLLHQNYKMLGSWPLALTAYNYGPYGLKRAVDLAGTTDLTTLIDTYENETWGFAAKNFYAEFLAIMTVVNEARTQRLSANRLNN